MIPSYIFTFKLDKCTFDREEDGGFLCVILAFQNKQKGSVCNRSDICEIAGKVLRNILLLGNYIKKLDYIVYLKVAGIVSLRFTSGATNNQCKGKELSLGKVMLTQISICLA